VDESACKKQKIAFSNKIATDGYAISFLLLAKKQLIKKFRASNWNYKTSQTQKKVSGLSTIEESRPSPKTASLVQYGKYVQHILEQMETIFSFYSYHRGEVSFKNYQSKQRAREELACGFLDGGKKYNAKQRKLTRKNRRRRKKRRDRRQAAIPASTLACNWP
jgi:hypothetical protein